MNSRAGVLLALLWLAGCAGSAAPPGNAVATQYAAQTLRNRGARLLFDDEFSGTSLDRSAWYPCYPYARATAGCSNNPSLELEWYEPQNVSVSGGALHLTARRQSRHAGYPYTSGMISTGGFRKPTFSFLYGYAQARIELPRGRGMWPAFWLVPANYTWPPEIDIMEWQGVTPRNDIVTIHWGSAKNQQQSSTAVNTGKNLYAGYHDYAIDWTRDSVTWYFDGKPIKTYTDRAHVPHQPMYVILNLAVGGWLPGQLRPSPSDFPATMSVDYVRIWSAKPS